MKRTVLVCISALLGVSQGFAQTTIVGTGTENIVLSNTNFTGTAGLPAGQFAGTALIAQRLASLHIDNTTVTGAQKGVSLAEGYGSFGMLFGGVGQVLVDNQSVVSGGKGRDVSTIATPIGDINSYGGFGMALQGSSLAERIVIGDGGSVLGGSGGTIENTYVSTKNLIVNGGAAIAVVTGTLEIQAGSTVQGGSGGTVQTSAAVGAGTSANGGRTLVLQNNVDLIMPSIYTLQGGDGGSIISAKTTTGSAKGGAAVELENVTSALNLSSGTFVGGTGGSVDGLANSTAVGGDALRILTSANVTLSGVNLVAGTGGTVNGVDQDNGRALYMSGSGVTVSGGSITGNVVFDGTGASSANFSGGQFTGDLLFLGTGASTVALQNSWNNVPGMIVQNAGTVTFTAYKSSQFTDTYINNGTMTFSGPSFTHEAGDTLNLLSTGSSANFTGGLTTEAGSVINTVYDVPGKNASTIRGSDLVFGQGTDWTIDIGDDVIGNGVSFDLAVATTSLSNGLGAVEYEGTGGSWLGGLNVSTVGLRLVATYGYIPFEDALDIDPFSVLGQSMSALSDFTDISNSADTEYAALKASDGTTAEGLLRTALGSIEMANVLIDAQQLYADQLKDRSRSYLRFSGVGTPAGGPSGAAGPVELPPGYQLWARGYGSMIAQDESGEGQGYDAIIAGAAAGADKRFDHLLLGFGGGYSRTDLKGTYDGDGEADSVYGSIYSTISGDQAFLELQGTAGYSDVTTSGSDVTGGYAGAFDAGTASFLIGGGMGIPVFKEKVVMTPEASLLSTYYAREGFTESQTTSPTTGAWPDKVYDSYDTMSYLAAVGASFTMINQIDIMNYELGVKPEVRLHWLHEFNDNLDNEPYLMESAGGPYTSQQAVLQAREEDLFKLGLGVRMSKWASEDFEFGLDLDVILAQDYEAVVGSAKALVRF